MDKDFIHDYALMLFVESKPCPGIFMVLAPPPSALENPTKSMLIRQLLHCLMISFVKSKNEDPATIRMIFEEVPNLVKAINALNNDDDLQLELHDYFGELVDFIQVVASEQSDNVTLIEELDTLTYRTVEFIKKFRQKLTPPIILQVHEYHQVKLKEKLEQLVIEVSVEDSFSNYSGDSSDVESSIPEIKSSSVLNEVAPPSSDVDLSAPSDDVESTAPSEVNSSPNEADPLSPPSESDKSPRNDVAPSDAPSEVDASAPTNEDKPPSASSPVNLSTPSSEDNPSASDDTESSIPPSTEVLLNQSTRSQKRFFDVESDAMLIHGVKTYGVGSWKIILNNYKFPSYRIPVHLKDRWRTLTTTGLVEHAGGKLTIKGKKQVAQFKLLSEAIAERRSRSTPVIRLKNKKSAAAPTLPSSSSRSGADSSKRSRSDADCPIPIISSDSDSEVEEVQSDYFPKKSPCSVKQPMVKLTDLWLKKNQTSSIPTQTAHSSPCQQSKSTQPAHSPTGASQPADRSPSQRPRSSLRSLRIYDSDVPDDDRSTVSNHPSSSRMNDQATNNHDIHGENKKSGNTEADVPPLDQEDFPKRKKKRRLWDVEGEMLTWDSDPLFVEPKINSATKSLLSAPSRSSEKKHRKHPWSTSEISNLITGLRRFGIGQWAMILDKYKFSNRNSVMLKDKYRNMVKNGELPRDLLLSSGK